MIPGQMSDFDDFDDEVEKTVFDPLNRRSEPRIERELEVKFTSIDDFVVSYTEDISRGGLFLKTDSFLPVGSTVRLELTLPDSEGAFSVIARVAYVLDTKTASETNRNAGMGMEFLDAENGDLMRQLEAYITLNFGIDSANQDVQPAQILIVGGDTKDIADGLRKERHIISTAATGMEALGLILSSRFELILSSVDLPLMDGWKLLTMVRQRPTVANTTFVFLSDGFSEEDNLKAYQRGVDDIIDRKVPTDDLCIRVNRTLARARQAAGKAASKGSLRGSLEETPLTSVLSFVELERRTGALLLVGESKMATLYVQDGRIIDVDYKDGIGEAAIDNLYEILNWTSGQFELTTCEVDRLEVIDVPTGFILMEHARRTDESS